MATLQCWSCIQFNKFHVNDNGIDGENEEEERRKNKIYLLWNFKTRLKIEKKNMKKLFKRLQH